VGLIASLTLADSTVVPKAATVMSGKFVTAYQDCNPPGSALTVSGFPQFPACTPERGNETCGFQESLGSGVWKAAVSKNKITKLADDIALSATVTKLSDGCDSLILTLSTALNATVNDCPASTEADSGCTIVTSLLGDFPVATCQVDSKANKCSVKTTVNSVGIASTGKNLISPGKRLSVAVRAIRLKGGGGRVFEGGVLLP
jgi:hypothetical protein